MTSGSDNGRGYSASAPTTVLPAMLATLVDELVEDARIVAWSEGIHQRAEYLTVRNAVLRHLVERQAIRVVAAETNFALSRPADAYIRGAGSDTPNEEVVRGMWSWGRAALRANLELLCWLRLHNAELPDRDRVRFYGLDMFGYDRHAPTDSGAALTDPEDKHLAATLNARLTAHLMTGGDHRAIAVRDAAQYLSLKTIAHRHPSSRLFLFEQTEHLDPRAPGSLGAHLARGELGTSRTVGAVWRDGDPTVTYPLGRYRELSRWLMNHPGDLIEAPDGTGIIDLRPWRTPTAETDHPLTAAAAAFDAVLYAPASTVALPWPAAPAR
ncbi:erythromycin esterase family protein [Nocardia callitridis]|uniref:Erythromycin esterase n=1 Tax=Nocardia callitridis TaxID=648753 RepID=A0ABP9KUX5_9NOCA